ncbi:MAG TPA: ROK family transcriptional regulator [Rugosimonospora sp.]|nr:ROK family transcriptional regulator [Rugosimonospora sp.]
MTRTGREPADFADVRSTNLSVVLGFVRANAPCSRADIAASTGLNKATVSSLVGELIERRLLRETGLTERRIGRPATMLMMDGAPYAAVGLEVNTDHLAVVAIDLSGERLLAWRRAFPGRSGSANKSLATIAALARRALARLHDDGRQVLGFAAGVAGLVDGDGSVRLAPNLGWRDVPLRDTLVHALGGPAYPVTVDNDANLAAQAEYRYGPHAGTSHLVHLTSEIGVGAGIVVDGRLLHGGRGYAGEVGHLPVAPDGPTCTCGRRGCLEAVGSVAALLRRVNGAEPIDVEPEVADLVRRARAQEPPVLAALRDAGHHLGYGAALLANLVNPEVVILGGYYVPLAPWLLPPAQEELRARSVAPEAGGCQLVASALGQDATATGGAAFVLDSVESGPLPLPALT